ncbi:hypothetical protein ACH518_13425 [Methylomonas sp. HW2-6]|uniref:hypothetical protein n=1 Tax=Methylomonas sp. HW2-6 TaxID=3376687 RepID=UPI00404360CE
MKRFVFIISEQTLFGKHRIEIFIAVSEPYAMERWLIGFSDESGKHCGGRKVRSSCAGRPIGEASADF